MRKIVWSLHVLLAVCALACLGRPDAGHRYFVAGVILTSAGTEQPGASVTAVPVHETGTASSLHWSSTDDKGRFKLALPRGRYEIVAKDERHGYPDPNFLLSADTNSRFPTVNVEDADIEGVRVILGEQGGILHILIRDGASLRPLAGAKAIIRDARDGRAFVELTADEQGNIQFAVPHKGLVILAEAPRYSRKSFHNGEEVRLSSGEQREITLDLTPD
jgi:hypothetical protein